MIEYLDKEGNCVGCGNETLQKEDGCYCCPLCQSDSDLAVRKPHPHTFNRAALTTIERAKAVCNQRADEYKDSWDLQNLKIVYVRAILERFGFKCTPEQERLIIMSSLCDVKLSRVAGPFKLDTYDDNINYTGALCELRREWEEQQPKGNQ